MSEGEERRGEVEGYGMVISRGSGDECGFAKQGTLLLRGCAVVAAVFDGEDEVVGRGRGVLSRRKWGESGSKRWEDAFGGEVFERRMGSHLIDIRSRACNTADE